MKKLSFLFLSAILVVSCSSAKESSDDPLDILNQRRREYYEKEREKEAEQTESDLQDITKIDLRDVIELKNPANKAELMKYKKKTPARIGISRAGTRYTTNTMLRFRADHASAVDAVYTDVSEEFLNANNLFTIQTKCHSKDEYMTRPDLGRRLSEESIAILKESPKVEIFVSDGLSSTAIEANVEDTLPAIINGLKSYGIEAGTPFFLKYGRVGAADEVSEILDAEVTCVLIGERPGLATSERMSAYITYKGYVGIPESKRTVVSNIHKNGTPASEAGAHIAHIIKKILDAKASGQDLKL